METTKLLESFKNDELELIYVLKAWEKLSSEVILDEKLSFENFYNNTIEVEALSNIFNKLAKEYKLFNLYRFDSKSYKKESLIMMLGIVKNNVLPNINEIFYGENTREFSVPNQIAELGMKLLNSNSKELYVPFSNGFAYANYSDQKICADYPLLKSALIAELINIIENKNIEFHMTDALEEPTFVKEKASHLLKQFDNVLSFPPLRLVQKLDISKDNFHRFKFHKGTVRDIAHFEHILAQTKKKAIVLMPVGFAYRANHEELFRRYLIENNLVESIIYLPNNLFSGTQTEMIFFIINKEKTNDKLYFINLKDNSFLIKDGKKTIFKDINEITNILNNKEEIFGVSSFVEKEQIINNSYSLAIDRYIQDPAQKNIQNKLNNFMLINLEEIADIRRSQLLQNEDEGIIVHEISPSDFNTSGFIFESGKIKRIKNQEKKLQTYKLEPYDVLLSAKGTIGSVCIVGEIKGSMIASQAIQVIRIKNSDKKSKAITLYMFLKSDLGQAILSSLVSGTKMPQISTDEIKQLTIPLLSNEQEMKLMQDFEEENKLNQEIEKLNKKIKNIHTNFLEN